MEARCKVPSTSVEQSHPHTTAAVSSLPKVPLFLYIPQDLPPAQRAMYRWAFSKSYVHMCFSQPCPVPYHWTMISYHCLSSTHFREIAQGCYRTPTLLNYLQNNADVQQGLHFSVAQLSLYSPLRNSHLNSGSPSSLSRWWAPLPTASDKIL